MDLKKPEEAPAEPAEDEPMPEDEETQDDGNRRML